MGVSEYVFGNQLFVNAGVLPAIAAISAASAATKAVAAGAATAIPTLESKQRQPHRRWCQP